MKNIRVFLPENFQFLEMKFSIYLNRHVFVMKGSEISISISKNKQRSKKSKCVSYCQCLTLKLQIGCKVDSKVFLEAPVIKGEVVLDTNKLKMTFVILYRNSVEV